MTVLTHKENDSCSNSLQQALCRTTLLVLRFTLSSSGSILDTVEAISLRVEAGSSSDIYHGVLVLIAPKHM